MRIEADGAKKRAEKRELARQARRKDFQTEADPLAMKMLRGEATQDEYNTKVTEIRARHPYPEEPET